MSSDLPQLIGRAKVGKSYDLTIVRDHKTIKVPFVVAELPVDDAGSSTAGGASKNQPDNNRLGVSVRDLTAEEKAATKLAGGVVLQHLGAGAAADAGLRPNDVIVKLNGKAVTNVITFLAQVKDLPADQELSMLVYREGNQLYVPFRLASDSKKK
jgi:serine protease Do